LTRRVLLLEKVEILVKQAVAVVADGDVVK
jgi:hypothetical protein